MKKGLLVFGAASVLSIVAVHAAAQTPGAAPPPPPAAAHSGFVGWLGDGVSGEVAATPGLLTVYTADASHAPVQGTVAQANIVKPDGSVQPVMLTWDATANVWKGPISGVTAGQYQVQVWFVRTANGPVAELTTQPLALVPGGALPEGGINIPLGGGHGVHLGGRHGSHVH